jgi:hypothetical protein
MKSGLQLSVAAALVLGMAASAWALPPVPAYVGAHYKENPEYEKFAAAYAAQKSKCDTCHVPGADKKKKGHGLNDFGKAVHDHFKHRDFTAADKAKDNPAEAAKAKELIAAALVAAEAEKNADGKTFGELMKAGQLPGKNN